jgi:hypothetical protein
MDEDGRSYTEAEVKFFSQCDTGSIPVIVLFTKFDALYDDEFAELISKGVSRKDAEALVPQHAIDAFASGPQLKLLYNRQDNQRSPRCHICLPDMDKDDADCGPLIERTADILDDDVLKQMFVSTQRTNLELCMRYAVKLSLADHLNFTRTISSRIFGKSNRQIIKDLGIWFPCTSDGFWTTHYYYSSYLYHPEDEEIWSTLRFSPSESSTLEKIMQLGSAAVIVFENTFYLLDQQYHEVERKPSIRFVHAALQQYIASPNAAAVREALSSAIQTYEAGSSRWIARSAKHSQKKEDLIETIIKIVLQHRLPRPQV